MKYIKLLASVLLIIVCSILLYSKVNAATTSVFTSPKTGEYIYRKSTIEIKWDKTKFKTDKVFLFAYNGYNTVFNFTSVRDLVLEVNDSKVLNSVPNTGSFLWTVPRSSVIYWLNVPLNMVVIEAGTDSATAKDLLNNIKDPANKVSFAIPSDVPYYYPDLVASSTYAACNMVGTDKTYYKMQPGDIVNWEVNIVGGGTLDVNGIPKSPDQFRWKAETGNFKVIGGSVEWVNGERKVIVGAEFGNKSTSIPSLEAQYPPRYPNDLIEQTVAVDTYYRDHVYPYRILPKTLTTSCFPRLEVGEKIELIDFKISTGNSIADGQRYQIDWKTTPVNSRVDVWIRSNDGSEKKAFTGSNTISPLYETFRVSDKNQKSVQFVLFPAGIKNKPLYTSEVINIDPNIGNLPVNPQIYNVISSNTLNKDEYERRLTTGKEYTLSWVQEVAGGKTYIDLFDARDKEKRIKLGSVEKSSTKNTFKFKLPEVIPNWMTYTSIHFEVYQLEPNRISGISSLDTLFLDPKVSEKVRIDNLVVNNNDASPLVMGKTYPITWKTNIANSPVDIWILDNGGTTDSRQIAGSNVSNRFDWTVPVNKYSNNSEVMLGIYPAGTRDRSRIVISKLIKTVADTSGQEPAPIIENPSLTLSLVPDKVSYKTDEKITLVLNAHNNTKEAITLKYNLGCARVNYAIGNVHNSTSLARPDCGSKAGSDVVIKPGANYQWQVIHSPDTKKIPAGDYVFKASPAANNKGLITSVASWEASANIKITDINAIVTTNDIAKSSKTLTYSCTNIPAFSVGTENSNVSALQDLLVKEGYLVMPKKATKGYYGDLTKIALSKYTDGCKEKAKTLVQPKVEVPIVPKDIPSNAVNQSPKIETFTYPKTTATPSTIVTPSVSATPSATVTPTATVTSTPTPSVTATPSTSSTPSPSSTATPSNSASPSSSPRASNTSFTAAIWNSLKGIFGF